MRKLAVIVVGVCLAGASFGQGVSDVRIESRNGGGVATVTNNALWVSTVDSNGRVARVDSATYSAQVIDYGHHEIHSGSHYVCCIVDTDLDTSQTNGFLIITTNSTLWSHMLIEADCSAAATLTVYEDIVQTNAGTAITPYNNNRNSANTSQMLLYSAADTVATNFGTTLRQRLLGSSSPGRTTGGNTRADAELILKQNAQYLITVVGDADNGRASLCLSWYEHTNVE